MTKRLTLIRLYELAHPEDKPCPRDPIAAAAWRRKRLGSLAKADADREKYEEVMAETRR
jgi:hypothetical protein